MTPNSQMPPSALGRSDDLDAQTITAGVLVSLLLHGSIIGLVVLGTWHTSEKIEEGIEEKMIEFEEVDLLALGEEKPPGVLPRISNPAPPEVEPEAVNIARKKAVNIAKEKKKPEDAVEKEEPKKDERKKKMLDALSSLHDPMRPTNEDLPEGHAEGVVGGTLSDAAKANLMGTYQAKLITAISRNWTVPTTIPPSEIKQLQGRVAVYIRLSGEGYIVSYNFNRRSGNGQFDLSIERVIKKFQVSGGGKRLPLPDNDEVRQIVLRQGLNLKSWEYTGQ